MNNSKVIVITGASSGIGEATAQRLAQDGHKVVLAARREEKLKSIVNHIEGEATYKVTDATSHDDLKALAQFTLQQYGRIDVWMNNAGVMALSPIGNGRVEDWGHMIDLNIKGVLYGINAALPTMREQQSGHFINISSVAGHKTSPGSAIYGSTKMAVRFLSETLRQEEVQAQSNVRVTVISPGIIDTNLPDSVNDEDVAEHVRKGYEALAVPPERVANAIAYAINSEEDTSLNEIVIRPTNQEL
ncbi:SDR family oxidoreductase [Staphylococcus epidermidis]|uniref:SDR family oxidoreductase n=1 Tax=Staphylococcus epidermidis TaxID=1282 RepID=UPI003F885094